MKQRRLFFQQLGTVNDQNCIEDARIEGTFRSTGMSGYPYISLAHSLILLRVAVAVFFMAHAAVRTVNGSIPNFGGFLETKGLPAGVVLVWLISLYELSAGLMMALGKFTRPMTAGFAVIVIGGIVLIHAPLGWFVGEHGVGGMEYSMSLLVSLLVVAAADGVALKKVS